MKNSIFVIKPYKWEGMWVFDDPNVGLVKEPFVGGADTMIDRATAAIPNADRGFLAVFSASYFPDAQIVLEWVREAVEPRKQSSAITRKLRLLRAHGLIHKVPKTHRYQLSPHGRDVINALLTARQASTAKLAA